MALKLDFIWRIPLALATTLTFISMLYSGGQIQFGKIFFYIAS